MTAAPRQGPLTWGSTVDLIADHGALRRGDGGAVVGFDFKGADGRLGLLVETGDGRSHVVPREAVEPVDDAPE